MTRARSHPPALGLDEAREVLAAQPFSVLVGARLVEFTSGRAVLEIPIRRDLLQQFGFVHGGVIAYAADNTLTIAGGTVLGPSIVTRGLSVDYLRPARGALLRAEATVLDSGRRRALCHCRILARDEDGSDTLCAVAQGSISLIDLDKSA